MKRNIMILEKLLILAVLVGITDFYLQAQTKIDEGKSVNVSMSPFGAAWVTPGTLTHRKRYSTNIRSGSKNGVRRKMC